MSEHNSRDELSDPCKNFVNEISDEQRETNWQTLAAAITAILADDVTPVAIHNGLVDFVLNACNDASVDVLAPEILPVALPLALRRSAAALHKRGLSPR